ncbi:MAG: hypothetical protein IPK82_26290 [Polyangiaceae bacterium]|nr:hypothetical protein [Polyangiaceae bacterium]
MFRAAWLSFALLSLAACQNAVESSDGGSGGSGSGGSGGSAGSVECVAPSNPEVFGIGTGEHCFEPLADGAEVPLMNGPQGGYHVWLAVGCQDCGSQVTLKYGVHDVTTGEPLANTYDLQSVQPLKGDTFPQSAGIIVNMPGIIWDPDNSPPLPKGTHFVLWVDAYQNDTLIHKGQVELIVGDIVEWNPCEEDPNNPACGFG